MRVCVTQTMIDIKVLVGNVVARHGPNRYNKFFLLYYTRKFLGLFRSKQKKVEVGRNPNVVSDLIKFSFNILDDGGTPDRQYIKLM